MQRRRQSRRHKLKLRQKHQGRRAARAGASLLEIAHHSPIPAVIAAAARPLPLPLPRPAADARTPHIRTRRRLLVLRHQLTHRHPTPRPLVLRHQLTHRHPIPRHRPPPQAGAPAGAPQATARSAPAAGAAIVDPHRRLVHTHIPRPHVLRQGALLVPTLLLPPPHLRVLLLS